MPQEQPHDSQGGAHRIRSAAVGIPGDSEARLRAGGNGRAIYPPDRPGHSCAQPQKRYRSHCNRSGGAAAVHIPDRRRVAHAARPRTADPPIPGGSNPTRTVRPPCDRRVPPPPRTSRGAGSLSGGNDRPRRPPPARPGRPILPRHPVARAHRPGRDHGDPRSVAVRNETAATREDHRPFRPSHRPNAGRDEARPIGADRACDGSDHQAMRVAVLWGRPRRATETGAAARRSRVPTA